MIDNYYALGRPLADNKEEIQFLAKIKECDYVRVIGNLARLGWRIESGLWRHKRIEETLGDMEKTRHQQINRTEAARKAALESKKASLEDELSVTGSVTDSVTGSVTSTQPQPQPQPQLKQEPVVLVAPLVNGDGLTIREVFDTWNAISGFSQCLVVSDKRRRHLQCRIADSFFCKNWRHALEKMKASDFCRGITGTNNWRASFDWFISPDAVAKLVEGKYDNRKQQSKKPIAA